MSVDTDKLELIGFLSQHKAHADSMAYKNEKDGFLDAVPEWDESSKRFSRWIELVKNC